MSESPRLLRRVHVGVANLWARADSPRTVDAPMVGEDPDVAGWLERLDAHPDESMAGDGRLGLHGRLLTQLVSGEPVEVVGSDPAHPGWVRVCAPWQPTSLDPRGYPGWVRASHLTEPIGPSPRTPASMGGSTVGPIPEPVPGPATGHAPSLVDLARRHLGLPYLWAGITPAGLDCSGLVHWCLRELGVVVPRDADDQEEACSVVPFEQVRSGDLYFFHQPGAARAHHVGIVTGVGSMIHAPETGQGLMEGPLDEGRRATLHSAGRLPR